MRQQTHRTTPPISSDEEAGRTTEGTQMQTTIGSSDTLIIKSRMASGAEYTVELQQKARTDADIQQFIDTVNDARETVFQVLHITSAGDHLLVEDITDRFDVRSIDEIEEADKRFRERNELPHYARRLQQQYGTLHARCGRVA
jgi:hypothetical protein